MNPTPEIAIIGAGNVAWHLARTFDAFAHVAQIMSPTLSHARLLSDQLKGCAPICSLSRLTRHADYYIVAVSDKAVREVAQSLPPLHGILAHTAGSVDMEALRVANDKIGVFYPLQTFTKGVPLDMARVPIFTQGANEEILGTLDLLAIAANGLRPDAQALACQAERHADSKQRACLHLAAVFACNFTNRLWGIAQQLLAQENYSLSQLQPLIQATLDKAMAMSPAQAQTGPAARRDVEVMQAHIDKLDGLNKEIYTILSKSIIDNNISK